MDCKILKSLVLIFERVALLKFTTKSAVPSLEISKLRVALPVVTVLTTLFKARSSATTLPEALRVAYIVF